MSDNVSDKRRLLLGGLPIPTLDARYAGAGPFWGHVQTHDAPQISLGEFEGILPDPAELIAGHGRTSLIVGTTSPRSILIGIGGIHLSTLPALPSPVR